MVSLLGSKRPSSQPDQGRSTSTSSDSTLGTERLHSQDSPANIPNPEPAVYGASKFTANKKPRQASPTPSELDEEERHYVNMAHCQLNGPLKGPLRDRHRSDIGSNHPAWIQARKFQRSILHTQQTIRRTPGLPPATVKDICDMLTLHAQEINNVIRETVDDNSEIRIQIQDANVALMKLKISEGILKHDVDQMQKQINDGKAQNEKTENRLADYHNDAEKDRNMIRLHLAWIADEADEEKKSKLTQDFIHELRKMAAIPHDIWVEPDNEPSEYEKAVARVKKANPGLLDPSTDEEQPAKPVETTSSAFDAGKWNKGKLDPMLSLEPMKLVEAWGSPSPRNGDKGKSSFLADSTADLGSPHAEASGAGPSSGGRPVPGSSQFQTPNRSSNNGHGPVGTPVRTPVHIGTPGRTPGRTAGRTPGHTPRRGPTTPQFKPDYQGGVYSGPSKGSGSSGGIGQRSGGSGPLAGPLGLDDGLRPKAPEFRLDIPSVVKGSSNASPYGSGRLDLIPNTSYGHQLGFSATSPGSFDHGGLPNRPIGPGPSPNGPSPSPKGKGKAKAKAKGSKASNGFLDREFDNFDQVFGSGGSRASPSRPWYGPSKYDNRAVVVRSQPVIQLGRVFDGPGGDAHDVERFEKSFSELFSLTRGFIVAWVAQDDSWDRNAPIMATLPKCYSGFTEGQAWSYIRQHMIDSLSRSCLFSRVVVDFVVLRILVPSAWMGFDFKSDAKIRDLDKDKDQQPGTTTSTGRSAYQTTVCDIVNSIMANDRYETFRQTRIEYFAAELRSMFSPLMKRFADKDEVDSDLNSLVSKAWSLSAKILSSNMSFDFRFPDAGSRFSLQSMVAVAPNLDGHVLQTEHWRVQLVVTPIITVRSDDGNTLSVHVTNLAETLLMK